MQHLLSNYLFQNKSCPLYGIGTLILKTKSASTDFLNSVIIAPQQIISLDKIEIENSNLVKYISLINNITILEAKNELEKYCITFKGEVLKNGIATMDGVGYFTVTTNDEINFTPIPLADIFSEPVNATRVHHLEQEHAILVGDKETTNTKMTDYYSDHLVVKKNNWWIWAILIACISICILILFYFDVDFSTLFGNATHINK